MNTAHNNIVESKSVLLSLLAYPDNQVLETFCAPNCLAQMHEWNVTLLRLAAGGFAVCDKQLEGTYVTYLFDEEEEARYAFSRCKEVFENEVSAE